ncbi:MAG: PilZ domain-containing protein [Thermochromatium sp.]
MDTTIEARYQDLSWGGASFITRNSGIQMGQRLTLHFPWTKGRSFAIEADVVRCEPLAPDSWRIAVRFAEIGHKDDRRLIKLIELLSSNSHEASHAADTPTMPMLELVLDDPEEMSDKLSQIAKGSLSFTAFGNYQIGQSLLLLIEHTEAFPILHLRARIKSLSVADPGDGDRLSHHPESGI